MEGCGGWRETGRMVMDWNSGWGWFHNPPNCVPAPYGNKARGVRDQPLVLRDCTQHQRLGCYSSSVPVR